MTQQKLEKLFRLPLQPATERPGGWIADADGYIVAELRVSYFGENPNMEARFAYAKEQAEELCRAVNAAPKMLEALRLVLAESAKSTSHTVLSAKAHAAVNAAIESARGPVTLPEEAR